MWWTSPYGSIEAGGTTLHRMICEVVGGSEERPALIDGSTGHVVSYGTLACRVERVAAGLAERGFGAGDVLGLWAPNMPQWAGGPLARWRREGR